MKRPFRRGDEVSFATPNANARRRGRVHKFIDTARGLWMQVVELSTGKVVTIRPSYAEAV